MEKSSRSIVLISATRFAVGRFEVTRDEYAAFVRDTALADPDGCNVHEPPRWPTIMGLNWHNSGFPQNGRDPVVCVSWLEAEAYTRWLSQKTGHHYRLLSEAEWEYAGRGGTQTQAYWGDDSTEACRYANGVDATLTTWKATPSSGWRIAGQTTIGVRRPMVRRGPEAPTAATASIAAAPGPQIRPACALRIAA
jgi:formylglycine-generating enzyme required for sulfatase activity